MPLPPSIPFRDGHHTYYLTGANANLWNVITDRKHERVLGGIPKDTFARALAGEDDNIRSDASKKVIGHLWEAHPALGPYPFIHTLSKFEFKREFYEGYRDHVSHQLKVFLLGLGIFAACPRIRTGVQHILTLPSEAPLDPDDFESRFALVWLVTAVFHDLGYVIENEKSDAGSKQWNCVLDEYSTTMSTPLSKTRSFSLTSDEETATQVHLSLATPKLGGSGTLEHDDYFKHFAIEADRARLGGPPAKGNGYKSAIARYYSYAQRHKTTREAFRDHGVASALLLERSWQLYDAYIDAWIEKADRVRDLHPAFDDAPLKTLQAYRKSLVEHIHRAAGAMSLHNITPSLWTTLGWDPATASLSFPNFRICLESCKEGDANGLAFLLGLVDTLQDWDRPTFSDRPKPEAFHAQDLSIHPDPISGRILFFVQSDLDRFHKPMSDQASHFKKVLDSMTGYLESAAVTDVLRWDDRVAPASPASGPPAAFGPVSPVPPPKPGSMAIGCRFIDGFTQKIEPPLFLPGGFQEVDFERSYRFLRYMFVEERFDRFVAFDLAFLRWSELIPQPSDGQVVNISREIFACMEDLFASERCKTFRRIIVVKQDEYESPEGKSIRNLIKEKEDLIRPKLNLSQIFETRVVIVPPRPTGTRFAALNRLKGSMKMLGDFAIFDEVGPPGTSMAIIEPGMQVPSRGEEPGMCRLDVRTDEVTRRLEFFEKVWNDAKICTAIAP
jgi:hypothetical protein